MWHTHAAHDGHFHPSHNRPHVSSHPYHQQGREHHHGHHHYQHDNHSSGDSGQRRPRRSGHQPRNPNYRLSRDELRSVALHTLDNLDNGWYIPDGTDVPVDLGPKMEYTNAQTTYSAPDDDEMAAWATKDLGQEKKETKILIKEYSTLVGARKLHGMLASLSQDRADTVAEVAQEDDGEGVEESVASGEESKEAKESEDQPPLTETIKEGEEKEIEAGEEVKESEKTRDQTQPATANCTIGVLNFASAKKPGGGFINGAQAQEESIARASTLYPSLTTYEGKKFYTHFRADPENAFYTHAMVYSPAVVLFKGDMGDLKKPIDVDILTSAAVNAGEVRENLRRDQEMHSLRVRVREAELRRRADIEKMWDEKERKKKEHEETKAAEAEKKAVEERERKAAEEKERKATEEIKAAEDIKAADEIAADEIAAAEVAADEVTADEVNAAEEREAVEEEEKINEDGTRDQDKASDQEKPTEEIKSDAEKVEVEPTTTQQTIEKEEAPAKVDVPKDDHTSPDNSSPASPPQPPAVPSKSLEPDSSSPPPADLLAPSKPLESNSAPPPGFPGRRTRPTFPPLRDLPPPPTLTLEDAEVIIAHTMRERIARLLFLFHQRGAMHLVLGSFGTGVFQNHVRLVAEIFYLLLAKPGAPFEGKFETVVFAILGGATVREFRDVFGEKAVPDGPDELDGEESEIEGMKDDVVGGISDPHGEDGKADEPAQSAGVPQQDGADEEKEMAVDQDVQTDAVVADDEAAKVTNELQDVEMVNLTELRTEDADSTSDPVPPTTTTDAQIQT